MTKIFEFFGFRSTDKTKTAIDTAINNNCPFLHKKCTKQLSIGISGCCALANTKEEVICCPNRLYADEYKILHLIAEKAFRNKGNLYSGRAALSKAKKEGGAIAVFGKEWGGELPLPKREGSGSYFVDWVLVNLDQEGTIQEFTAIEVQTIDTTGNYQNAREALLNDRSIVNAVCGFNWENVNKRIIPQIIYKGQILQRETKCNTGLFFVCNKPVYDRVIQRLGGVDKLDRFPRYQPASVTFIAYDYLGDSKDGAPAPLGIVDEHSTTVYKIQEAFSAISLPEADVFLRAINKELYGSEKGPKR